jgi:hypothetical protein
MVLAQGTFSFRIVRGALRYREVRNGWKRCVGLRAEPIERPHNKIRRDRDPDDTAAWFICQLKCNIHAARPFLTSFELDMSHDFATHHDQIVAERVKFRTKDFGIDNPALPECTQGVADKNMLDTIRSRRVE